MITFVKQVVIRIASQLCGTALLVHYLKSNNNWYKHMEHSYNLQQI